jgi:hypothetical protein
LSIDPEKDTETVFGWRLELARQGLDVDEHNFELHLVNELANHNQVRACALLSAVLEGYIQYCRRIGSMNEARRIEIHNRDSSYLLKACQSECREFWHQLIPVFGMVVILANELKAGPEGLVSYDSRVSTANLARFMAELLQLSGAERLKQEGSMFIQELEELIQPPASSYLRQLIVNILSAAPAGLADEAIDCFLQIESPLDINTESALPNTAAMIISMPLRIWCSDSMQAMKRRTLKRSSGDPGRDMERGQAEPLWPTPIRFALGPPG